MFESRRVLWLTGRILFQDKELSSDVVFCCCWLLDTFRHVVLAAEISYLKAVRVAEGSE